LLEKTMTQTSTILQILSDEEQGLLPYLDRLLQGAEYAKFRAQFSFHAEDAKTQVKVDNGDHQLRTTLSISLKCTLVLEHQTDLDEAIQLALEFQELLDIALVQWSQRSPLLLSPLTQIEGALGNLEEVHYRGAYLPGFAVNRKFELTYSSSLAEAGEAKTLQEMSSTKKRGPDLYSPGERTPQSGQYEVTNLKGEGTGMEVTSTQGNPLPPTLEPNQLYKLVDPTRHKKAL
jgi:hypothetical protein